LTADDRSPVPAPLEQEESEELIKELFKADYASTAKGARAALAAKLLNQSRDETDVAARFVLLREARDIATQAHDVDVAFAAIDSMAASYAVDSLDLKREALAAAPTSKLTLLQKDALASAWTKLIDQAVAEDEYESAIQLAESAAVTAKKLRDSVVNALIDAKQERVEFLAKRFTELKPHFGTLLADPDDAPSNLAVGEFYSFEKNDFVGGLPQLSKSPASSLQSAAAIDQEAGVGSADTIDAGDVWFDLAKKADKSRIVPYQARAAYWYRRALVSASGLAATKIEQRLEQLKSAEEALLLPIPLSELGSAVYSKSSRGGWTDASLDEFSVARTGGTLLVKNTHLVREYAYLTRKIPLHGDFVAELHVKGALAVGLMASRKGNQIYTTEVLLKNATHRVRVERTGGEVSFWVDRRKVTPRASSRGTSKGGFSASVQLFVQIGKRKTCYLRRLDLYAARASESARRSKKYRKKDRGA
jgi:hypothetical protein